MLEKIKSLSTPIVLIAMISCALACFFYGAHVERLEADKQIALLEKEYAEKERDSLRKAESIRQDQERKFVSQIASLKRDSADRLADAERVRKQLERLASSRSDNIEQCNRRASRCNDLLSEAYELARESEELLRDRDARLTALSVE